MKFYKAIFPDGNCIVTLYDDAWALVHYLNDDLGIKHVKVRPLSCWESFKYVLNL